MKSIRVAQASDLHYCEKHLQWVDAAMTCFVTGAIDAGADVAVLSGDSFDHQTHVHEPALHAFLRQIARLADHMPVLVLQGTFSHDRPGSLDVLKTIRGKFHVHVADKIQQVDFRDGRFVQSMGYRFEGLESYEGIDAIFSCLPSIHKGTVKAMAGDTLTKQRNNVILES